MVLQYYQTNGEVSFLKVAELTTPQATTAEYHSKTFREYLEHAQTNNFAYLKANSNDIFAVIELFSLFH